MSPNCDLLQTNEPEPEPAPRLFLARGRQSTLLWFSRDVPRTTVAACRTIAAGFGLWNGEQPVAQVYDPLRVALARDAPISSETHGPAFRFPEQLSADTAATVVVDERSAELLDRFFPYTRRFFEQRSPVVGVVEDGAVVAACYSARRRPSAAEAGVDTMAAYRRQGFARATVAAWASIARSSGMTPLYSTSWGNLASRRLAAGLGLIAYAETLALT